MGLWSNLMLAWKNKDKIKVVGAELDAIRGAVKAAPQTGYISSEFLTVIVGAGFVLWNSFSGKPLPDLTQELVAGIVGGYAALRTGLKAVHQVVAAWHSAQIVPAAVASVAASPTPLP